MANKLLIGIIIGLAIGLITGGIAGSLISRYRGNKFPRIGNAQLTESQISEINSFFGSNPDSIKMQEYCSQHRDYCVYYCRNINRANVICNNMSSMSPWEK